MPLQATSGAASYDGFGGGPAAVPNYIEECFATHLYTGNDSTQTITNGIDLAGKGGLTWIKVRDYPDSHRLFDTSRGVGNYIVSNSTSAQLNNSASVTAFNSNGFSLGSFSGTNGTSFGSAYVSWTFREQPKFFDVVTWTGDGTSNRAISHSLGSAPGCIIAKRTDAVGNWNVYHRGVSPANDNTLTLNTTSSASGGGQDIWGNGVNVTTPTTTSFYVAGQNNNNGVNYVAYLFAHDAGGFGLTGTDNVISCGSFTVSGNAATVNLGYEPQWLLIKSANSVSAWDLFDSMRGLQVSGNQPVLNANNSGAEFGTGSGVGVNVTSTGFATNGYLGNGDHIYIAIRRGPMKTPTTGTSVYENVAYTGNATANRQIGSSVLMDAMLLNNRDATAQSWSTYGQMFFDRLRGDNVLLATASTSAESTGWQTYFDSDMNVGWDTSTTTSQDYLNKSGATFVSHIFRRAPGFFDVVCYTGTGSSATSYSHNLGVAPELIINKVRSASGSNWIVTFNFTSTNYVLAALNLTIAGGTFLYTDGASIEARPTSTAMRFTGGVPAVNDSGQTYVAYLFASCPGVSKVFSFTGNGSSQTINCGFTGGSRLVLIKRTDSTGNWVIFDSARGIVSGNDPALYLNSTAAEVTGVDAIDTDSTGFIVNQETTFNLNVNNATYIGLAIS